MPVSLLAEQEAALGSSDKRDQSETAPTPQSLTATDEPPAVVEKKKKKSKKSSSKCVIVIHNPQLVDVIKMLSKAWWAAFGWELVSSMWTKNPDEITEAMQFFLYSMTTGFGAGAGMVIGATAGSWLTQKMKLVEAQPIMAGGTLARVAEEDMRLALKENWVQRKQLFFITASTDGLWGPFFRLFNNSRKNSLGSVGWMPLASLGFVFVVVSKIVHRISRRCFKVRKKDSFNPKCKDVALILSVALAELGFAGGSYLSAYLKILDGGISNDVGARIVDALLTATVAGAASTLPYLFILFKSWCSQDTVRAPHAAGDGTQAIAASLLAPDDSLSVYAPVGEGSDEGSCCLPCC